MNARQILTVLGMGVTVGKLVSTFIRPEPPRVLTARTNAPWVAADRYYGRSRQASA